MIDHWISTGHAHWSVLVDVLEGPVFGETELADKIATKHFSKSNKYQLEYINRFKAI